MDTRAGNLVTDVTGNGMCERLRGKAAALVSSPWLWRGHRNHLLVFM